MQWTVAGTSNNSVNLGRNGLGRLPQTPQRITYRGEGIMPFYCL